MCRIKSKEAINNSPILKQNSSTLIDKNRMLGVATSAYKCGLIRKITKYQEGRFDFRDEANGYLYTRNMCEEVYEV